MKTQVRKLEWVAGDGFERDPNSYKADDGFGGYYFVIDCQWWRHPYYSENVKLASSDDEAKRQAQEHFEKLVRATLAGDKQQTQEQSDQSLLRFLVGEVTRYLEKPGCNGPAKVTAMTRLQWAVAKVNEELQSR